MHQALQDRTVHYSISNKQSRKSQELVCSQILAIVLVHLVVGDVADLFQQVPAVPTIKVPDLLSVPLLVEDELVTERLQAGLGRQMLVGVGVVAGRRIHRVEGQPERLLHGLRNEPGQQGRRQLQARIGVDFYQPGLEVLVDHEVEPEQLETVLQSLGRQLQVGALDRVQTDGFHLGQDLLLEVVAILGVVAVQVPLKLGIRQLVAGLVLAIQGRALLHCVIGEMDLSLEVVDVELVGGGPDIALPEPVRPHEPVQVGHQHVVPDVELAPLIQHGPVDVQLDDECLLAAVLVQGLLPDNLVQLVDLVDDGDAIATVGQLTRLHYPHIPHLLALAPLLLLLLLYRDLAPLVVGHESLILDIVGALFDVEGEGDASEGVLAQELVVLLQVVEQSLFVAQVEVVHQMVVHFGLVGHSLLQLEDVSTLGVCWS